MEILDFGRSLLWLASGVAALIFLLALGGILAKDRRFIVAARTGFYALFLLVLASAATLVHGFVAGAYNNEYIFNYSERNLDLFFKIAGLWAGLDGSLLFWTLILCGASALCAFQHHWSARHPSGRRIEPYAYLVLSGVSLFFIALCVHPEFSPFRMMPLEERLLFSRHYRIPLDAQGNLTDGAGLNPQLVNYWFVFHPPNLYLGLVLFTVPFALAMGALLSGELGDYWIRVTRRWAMVSWLFLTCGIVLGGLWAYRQLGWGGYWAWDPVENASFLPWCTATAFLHSIMIQERRDMLKGWNVFLILFTFFLTIEATYMTRSGEVASVHSFAGGDTIGVWFRCFKVAIAGLGLFFLFARLGQLRGRHKLESYLSREAAFFFNNLVLVAIALAVWFLSWLPKNSHSYLPGIRPLLPESVRELVPDQLTNQGSYAIVMTPLLALLLLLTAIGPGLGWVRTTAASFRKNFAKPLLASALFVGAVYLYLGIKGEIRSAREVFIPKFVERWLGITDSAGDFYAVGLYPTGLFLFLSALIIATVSFEFLRALKARVRHRGEDALTAALRLVARDNRRYGGYIVHVGVAVLAAGIIVSSMFKIEKELHLRFGESVTVGPYVITPVEANRDYAELSRAVEDLRAGRRTLAEIEPGRPYLLDQVRFRVEEAAGGNVAHGEAEGAAVTAGPVVCELIPERRYYPKQSGGQWISEVSIYRRLLGDIYVYYYSRDADNRVHLTIHLNPFMLGIWAGWFIMVLGSVVALLPLGRRRIGLAD